MCSEYCAEHVPKWNTISISGYHIREAGSTAVQEIAFTLSDGIAYVEAALEAGLEVDRFAPRLSFFFNAHNHFFEEIAKFRAARRIWAKIMKERFNASNERSLQLRFHTQTGGSTLTAQQPDNNIVRVTLQALAAVLGGTQSLHTNSRDEALALPTEESARIALRTQQIIAHESGVADTVDPLGGSYYIEALTDQIEKEAWRYIEKIDEMGGAVRAVEEGYMQQEIHRAALAIQREIESGRTSGGWCEPLPFGTRDRTAIVAGGSGHCQTTSGTIEGIESQPERNGSGGKVKALEKSGARDGKPDASYSECRQSLLYDRRDLSSVTGSFW